MKWNEMNDKERHETIKNMKRYGGGFASTLGELFERADSWNLTRLVDAFPDFIERYQPENWKT